jgi:hypothetical protein
MVCPSCSIMLRATVQLLKRQAQRDCKIIDV